MEMIQNNDMLNVLSIEQMLELESLGLDTSDASCMWTSIQNKDYEPYKWLPVFRGDDRQTIETLRNAFPLTYKEGNIFYCYTYFDVINKLPEFIHIGSNDYVFRNGKKFIYYVNDMNSSDILKIFYDNENKDNPNMVNIAFNTLKWCIENNYL